MDKHIKLPLSESDIASLHAGDSVYLDGVLYTARDAAHKRMYEFILNELGQKEPAGTDGPASSAIISEAEKNRILDLLPFDLRGAVIYYLGPTPAKPDQVIGSAGPTTSGRMDRYTPLLLDFGLRGMIGKGRRSEAVEQSIYKNNAIYMGATGGAGALLSKCIKSSEVIAYEDLGTEAVRKLYVEDFPVTVLIK